MSRIQARDTAIQKHFKALGLLTENPKEAQSVQKCRADFSRVESLTDDKIALAERMARLLQRHLAKLQIELGKLQGQPVPNIAARFGMRLPPEQISQSAFSPAALPGGPLMESSNKRAPSTLLHAVRSLSADFCTFDTGRKTGLEPISVSRANSPAMPSSLSRASSSQMPSTSSSLAAPPSSSGGRKRKTPIPEEEDADAEGEVDASGSDDNDFGEQDAEGENDMPGASSLLVLKEKSSTQSSCPYTATGDDALYCVCQKVSYGEVRLLLLDPSKVCWSAHVAFQQFV